MARKVIGEGAVGFTAEGLNLVREELLGQLSFPTDAEVAVEVPAFAVIAADVFSAFLKRNHFRSDDFAGVSNRQIVRIFQGGELPHGLMEELEEVAVDLAGPVVVRPSSVLEATLGRSFGGAYSAKLIPNLGEDMVHRRRQMADAVKLVWASTYFADAVNWRLAAGQAVDAEQMAVVVQRAVGSQYGHRFYPTVSVVARSYNHYPAPGNEPDEGVVTLALGFGKAISEGHSWSYSPDRTTAPPPFKSMSDMLSYSQTSFWALDLSGETASEPHREAEHLVRLSLADAETDGVLNLLASTYDAASDRLREGIDGAGVRVLTFAPILGSRRIPFNSVIRNVLEQARGMIGREVEIEMSATLDPETGFPARFGIVQLKTMAGRTESELLGSEDLTGDDLIVASEACLGNGVRVDLEDVVYLKPTAFDRGQTRTMAAELEAVNRGLLDDRRQAVFVGFGRWGTTDERFGIPVRWGQISSAQVIVEVAMTDAPVNVSQGTHFFHHILSQQVLYLSLEPGDGHTVDFDWLDGEKAIWEGRYVRHVRLDSPLLVNVDGASRRGLIRRRLEG